MEFTETFEMSRKMGQKQELQKIKLGKNLQVDI